MSRRSFIYLVCAVLMLIAQHGALTHAVWHLGEGWSVEEHLQLDGESLGSDGDSESTQSNLCDLHIVMSSLLAGDCAGPSMLNAALLHQPLAASFAVWPARQFLLTPPARAPPALL
jgi:hypothetical protein